MALREKFGRLVLLEETDAGPLGSEYRAARLGPSGFERLVSVLRFVPAVSAHAEASKRLVEEARLAAQVQSAGLVRVLGVGRVGASCYLSTELVEGRTLRAALQSCREGGFPFAADHALMIGSRAAAALELLHGRKDDAGRGLVHGLVSPRQLVVAFDGEVKVKGLGLWSALGATELLGPEERAWLAPEQATGRGDARSDVYALGLVMLEALSGPGADGVEPLARVAAARLSGPVGEAGPLPPPLVALLRRALAPDPASRFQGMSELRRAIDALLFSGDFTPTTFDLAFFMHTLFREEVERDARAIEQARSADYTEFMGDEPARAPAASPARTEPVDPRSPAPDATEAVAAQPTLVPPPTEPEPQRSPEPAARAAAPDSSQARRAVRSREAGAREAAARLSLGAAPARRARPSRSLTLALGVVAAVGLGGGAGWLYFVAQRRASRPPQPSAEQLVADARVRELEARIAQLEREKAEAEARAAEDARASVEQAAAAGGQAADPAAVARAQDEARRRAREEQERRQREELERLAAEKEAEQRRLADARAAAAATPPVTAPTATPAPTPTPTPTPALTPPPAAAPATPPPSVPGAAPVTVLAGPGDGTSGTVTESVPVAPPPAVAPATPGAVRPGTLVDFTDPGLIPPVITKQAKVQYPPIALAARLEGVVDLRALVDEHGDVKEVTIVRCSRPGARFEEAAERQLRSRKYRPATKDGVPVRVWLPIVVNFRITR